MGRGGCYPPYTAVMKNCDIGGSCNIDRTKKTKGRVYKTPPYFLPIMFLCVNSSAIISAILSNYI